MATVINTPGNTDTGEGGAGWVVVVIVLLGVIGVGMYFWMNYTPKPAVKDTTNINVTLPTQGGTSSTN